MSGKGLAQIIGVLFFSKAPPKKHGQSLGFGILLALRLALSKYKTSLSSGNLVFGYLKSWVIVFRANFAMVRPMVVAFSYLDLFFRRLF